MGNIFSSFFGSNEEDNKVIHKDEYKEPEENYRDNEEEKDEPEKDCTFQVDYDEEEKTWDCFLVQNNNITCNKDKCPFWRN